MGNSIKLLFVEEYIIYDGLSEKEIIALCQREVIDINDTLLLTFAITNNMHNLIKEIKKQYIPIDKSNQYIIVPHNNKEADDMEQYLTKIWNS
jgi:hypothetical protein